jgi:hypothetical protein
MDNDLTDAKYIEVLEDVIVAKNHEIEALRQQLKLKEVNTGTGKGRG